MKQKAGLFVLESPLIYLLIGFLILSTTIYLGRRWRAHKHNEAHGKTQVETHDDTHDDTLSETHVEITQHQPVPESAESESKSRKIPLAKEIVEHYCSFLKTSPTILDDIGDIAIVVFPPKGKRGWWTFATAGLSKVTGIELTFCSYNESDEIVAHLSDLSRQIINQHQLNAASVSSGSVFTLTEPIVPNSLLSHALLIPPYFEEDGFEFYIDRGELVHVLALVPITEQESHFCLTYGQSALESKFEEHECNTLDFFRESTV
ncbi:suppressor of fused domain protein [Brevibacillus sp. SYSU BS000544]|uniref:suppressor of fused domain protein n=1 Tax=Brevibacillus sp. SYSU BS000544 TaxID=3416443 RepID=UPI003CE53797